MTETPETKACPWCGETILAVAKKCKHCGEYLEADGLEPAGPEPADGVPTADVPRMHMPTKPPAASDRRNGWKQDPTKRFPFRYWDGRVWTRWVNDRPDGTTQSEDPLYVAEMPVAIINGVPTCVLCGGTQFTARRKTSTKVMFGLSSLLGKPQFVECEACGARYQRLNA